MTGFILKCITSACSLQTEVYRYSLYSRVVGVRCFSSKNASGSPVIKHYCILKKTTSAARETTMKKVILATMTNAILPSCALLQLRYINIVHLLLYCCGFGGNNNSETKAKQKLSCCLANQLLLGISACSYERAVLAPLPGAIGACIIRCEKACPVARNWPQIFMMQSILQDIQICVISHTVH